MADAFWVFGYGSLMWNPGFDYVESARARLDGYRRSFCLESTRYRGTAEQPGLVLALVPEEEAHCIGIAFRVDDSNAVEVLRYLRHRELDKPSYFEKRLPMSLTEQEGREVVAICYVMNVEHGEYRGHLDDDERAAIIAKAHGPAGSNREYLYNTASNLDRMNVEEPHVERLTTRVRQLSGDA
jgi:cation transport protein ChaC